MRGCVVVVEHFRRRETGEYFYTQTLSMGRHPLDHIAKRDYVATVVVEVAWHQPARGAGCAGFAEHQQVIALDGLVQRCAQLFPVRNEFVHRFWVHDSARQDVRAWL